VPTCPYRRYVAEHGRIGRREISGEPCASGPKRRKAKSSRELSHVAQTPGAAVKARSQSAAGAAQPETAPAGAGGKGDDGGGREGEDREQADEHWSAQT
jgi:hypothetical protein